MLRVMVVKWFAKYDATHARVSGTPLKSKQMQLSRLLAHLETHGITNAFERDDELVLRRGSEVVGSLYDPVRQVGSRQRPALL